MKRQAPLDWIEVAEDYHKSMKEDSVLFRAQTSLLFEIRDLLVDIQKQTAPVITNREVKKKK